MKKVLYRSLLISVIVGLMAFKICHAESILSYLKEEEKVSNNTPYTYLYIGNDTYYLLRAGEKYYMKNGVIKPLNYPDEIISAYQPQWRYSTGDYALPVGGNGIFAMFLSTDIPTQNKSKGMSAKATYIFDSDFNVIGRYQQNGEITEMYFQDGLFYFITEEINDDSEVVYNTYKTVDFKTVDKCDNATKKLIQNKNYAFGIYQKKIRRVGTSGKPRYYYITNDSQYEISYEDENFENVTISEKNNILITRDAKISIDGVYWFSILLPEDVTYNNIWSIGDLLYIESDDKIYNYCINRIDNVMVRLNDKILAFEQPPVIEEGRTLVPMRFLFEQMGAEVEWNAETKTAKAKLNNTAVSFSIDDTNAEVNSESVTMDVPAQLVNGKTMVPLRFLSEELGYTVTWDEETRTAVIE